MPVVWSAVAATLLPGVIGTFGSLSSKGSLETWYQTIKLPNWTPPSWAFPLMWNSLSSIFGYGSYLVYRDGGGFDGPARWPLILYGSSLLCNWAWMPIFFTYHNLKLAYYETHLTTLTTLGSAYLFYEINSTAGYLFIPYILWHLFSSALSYSMYKLNSNGSRPKITELKGK